MDDLPKPTSHAFAVGIQERFCAAHLPESSPLWTHIHGFGYGLSRKRSWFKKPANAITIMTDPHAPTCNFPESFEGVPVQVVRKKNKARLLG